MKHLSQLARVRRHYDRFKAINDGDDGLPDTDLCMDTIVSFFMHCYHLKDWLINDVEFPHKTRNQIEDFVTNTESLAIAADICNCEKHLELDRDPRSGDTPELSGRIFNLNVGGNTPDTMQLQNEHGAQLRDAFEIATDAMEQWDNFINRSTIDGLTAG